MGLPRKFNSDTSVPQELPPREGIRSPPPQPQPNPWWAQHCGGCSPALPWIPCQWLARILRLSLLSHLTPTHGPRTGHSEYFRHCSHTSQMKGMPAASIESLGTRHSVHCPWYIKHFRGTVKPVNCQKKKNIPGERGNSTEQNTWKPPRTLE